MGPVIGKWVAGLCVLLLVVVLLVKAIDNGNHPQAAARGAQSVIAHKTSTVPPKADPPKRVTKASGKGKAKSNPVPRNVQGKSAPKEPKGPLKQRVASFLDAYYYVSPTDTEESHRVYIASEASFVSSSWLNHASFGIETNNVTNRKRWSNQLTLTAKFNTSSIHKNPATDGSGNIVVTVPVRVSAQDVTGRTVYAQTRQTTSVWRNKSSGWTLLAFTDQTNG